MNNLPRRFIILGIALSAAFLHLIGIGRHTRGLVQELYSSYFSDVVLPFVAYFLCGTLPFLPKWWQKAAVTFGMASAAEFLQGFGIYALGKTFDPLDFAAYAAGTLIAVSVERLLFAKYLKFWDDVGPA